MTANHKSFDSQQTESSREKSRREAGITRKGAGKVSRALWCTLPLMALSASEGSAEERKGNLGDLSIEQLMNEPVTTVSKKEQKLGDAAAAISVLSNDDIRRSGATTIADALRLVPGVQVASIDSGNWAVSARGFNSQFSNKLLVMIDGRTVYSPLFSGVYWDAQQMLLADVDRIEVIRGPGATIWGANAVNGVINIVSKSARDTQGGLVYGGGGNEHLALGGARYGGKTGEDTYYRVYGTYQLNDDFDFPNGEPANDSWDLGKGGFRLDHYTKADGHATWQGDAYAGNLSDRTGDLYGVNTLGRWTQRLSERSNYEVQAYFDHTYRNDVLAEISLNTVDLTFQHTFGLGDRNDVIWGCGYRFINTQVEKSNHPIINVRDPEIPLNLFSAFVQDEFKIIPDKLIFTLGTKFEHNDFTGLEVQPSARLAFKPSEKQTIGAAVSRAVRTPSEYEGKDFVSIVTGTPAPGPGGIYVPTVFGNPEAESESLLAYELGYRIQPSQRVSVDIATFYNDYADLLSSQRTGFVPGVPVGLQMFTPMNSGSAESYGAEATVAFAPTDSLRLSASYSLLMIEMHGDEITDNAESTELNAPTHQVVLRSSSDLTSKLRMDAQVRYVDNVESIAHYVTADLRLSYRLMNNLELSVVGQNLLDSGHPEQASPLGLPNAEVPRSIYGKLTWYF
jgi:iron complex outermembrane recepter protein